MRGKANALSELEALDGITPAYAGKRQATPQSIAQPRDHPRVCGEKAMMLHMRAKVSGSPQRMRGKVFVWSRFFVCAGITPAYAGKSHVASNCPGDIQDHPRVCGEKAYNSVMPGSEWGSPPRMRGKATPLTTPKRCDRITPAYAGKRPACTRLRACTWDHPRVCGEKLPPDYHRAAQRGSPPRMRGKGRCNFPVSDSDRITPAYAGKRLLSTPWTLPCWDHPRVCGEKSHCGFTSPRC